MKEDTQIISTTYTQSKRLRRVSGSDRLRDAGDLAARADDLRAGRVAHEGDILVFPLGTLPDLDLATTTEDTHSHSGEQVVRRVGVVVHTTVEDGGSVLANAGRDHGLSTRVVLDEVGNIVNNTGNSNESAAVLGLLLILVPVDDGQLLKRYTPVERGALLVELLL